MRATASHRPWAFLLLLALIPFGSTGCGGHKIETDATSPDWGGNAYQHILVIHLVENSARRITTESAVTASFKAKGVQADVSYDKIVHLDQLSDETAVRDILSQGGYDAIFTAYATPEIAPGAGDYFSSQTLASNAEAGRTAFTRIQRDAVLGHPDTMPIQIDLWDATTLRPVWAGGTNPYVLGNANEESRKFGDMVVAELQKRGLI